MYGSRLIVLAEHKPVEGAATYDNSKGITLITASGRRNPPQCLDSKIHHNNLLNNILPKIQANVAGAAVRHPQCRAAHDGTCRTR